MVPIYFGVLTENDGDIEPIVLKEGEAIRAGHVYELTVVRRVDSKNALEVFGVAVEDMDVKFSIKNERHSWARLYRSSEGTLRFRVPPQAGAWRISELNLQWETDLDGFNSIELDTFLFEVR